MTFGMSYWAVWKMEGSKNWNFPANNSQWHAVLKLLVVAWDCFIGNTSQVLRAGSPCLRRSATDLGIIWYSNESVRLFSISSSFILSSSFALLTSSYVKSKIIIKEQFSNECWKQFTFALVLLTTPSDWFKKTLCCFLSQSKVKQSWLARAIGRRV